MRDYKTFMACAVILIAAMYVISIGPASASENSEISAIFDTCEAEADGGTSGVEIAKISMPRAKTDGFTNSRCGIRYEPWLHAVIGKEIYEQETAEEVGTGVVVNEDEICLTDEITVAWTSEAETVENQDEVSRVDTYYESTPEPIPEVVPETTAPVAQTPQELLQNALNAAGIGWWWPYAWAQAMQESSWNPLAVSPDARDKGLFQYREQFWTEPESIFDVNAQIRRYVREVSARLNAGLSIEEVISRHYTSDYITDIAWDYVNAVLQWVR